MNAENSQDMIRSRILRDVNDGVMAVDTRGTIIFANPQCDAILNADVPVGEKYISFMMKDPKNNDEFHQMILDAVEDKDHLHQKVIPYIKPDGTEIKISMKSSFIRSEDGKKKEGITLVFTDVTEEELLNRKVKDSAVSFIILLAGLCVWIFIYALNEFLGQPLSFIHMTNLLLVMSGVMLLIYTRFTVLTLEDLGLSRKNLKRNLLEGVGFAIIGVAVVALVKLGLMHVMPEMFPAPLVDFSRFSINEVKYIIEVVWQEFIARGVVHESLRRIIPGRHGEGLALLVSSLFFGALHIHGGIIYMVGASLLLGILGTVYVRQESIWGTCIPHYVLGVCLVIFGLNG